MDYTEGARAELQRVDHLIYVSLKYTRTVDVIRSIVERLMAAFDFMVRDLLDSKSDTVCQLPQSPGKRCELAKELYDDEKIHEIIDFYLFLRRVFRARYKKINEFRRHVTLIAETEENGIVNVDIDLITEYFQKTKKYVEYVEAVTNE